MNREVLIIDDDKIVLILHRLKVSRSGIHNTPATFESAKDALNFIVEKDALETQFLLLLDINMFDMDGWEMMEEMAKLNTLGTYHIILLTSSIDDKDKKKALLYPLVVDYIEKPFKDEDIELIKNHPKLVSFFSS
jgi:CheY-like chemotaxis protein